MMYIEEPHVKQCYTMQTKASEKDINAQQTNIVPTACHFWQKKFGFIFKEEVWHTAWKTKKETRLRVLQWKILHNIYPTNILLNKMNVRESDECTLRPDTIYYIKHFFCECPILVNFLKSIEQKVYRETGLRVELSVQTILFGLQNSTLARFKVDYINHIILVAKMCISTVKKTERVNSLHIFFEKEIQLRNITIR